MNVTYQAKCVLLKIMTSPFKIHVALDFLTHEVATKKHVLFHLSAKGSIYL